MDPYYSVEPKYEHTRYPPPPLPSSYLNFPDQNASILPIHHPPPHLAPLSVPPPMFFQSVPPPQLCTSQFHSALDPDVECEALYFESLDKDWVGNWLAQRNIQPPPRKPLLRTVQLKNLHGLLVNSSSVVKELQKLYTDLSSLADSADESQWNSVLANINEKKAELSLLLKEVCSLDLTTIKAKLNKRAKKRSWIKRRRCQVSKSQQAEQNRQNMLHQRADTWLAEMRLAVEREHREKELRREADAVLGEVTRKQAEAKRQISLLDALMKLRQVRAQRFLTQTSHQDVGLDHSTNKFATVIERLRKLWKTQLKDYGGEERGLRAMLLASAAQKTDARCKRVKFDIDQWHKAIFGESFSNVPVKQDINQFLNIRAEWDKYVVRFSANAPMTSTIPVGWVLPQEPSSAVWRSYCVAYKKHD